MIDVIIPVYRGEQQTRRSIESVLAASNRTPLEIVVVDDASPEPAISRYLQGLAAQRRITLLTNETNLGFIHSTNRGMSLHGDRDVILLNSDTEVANDWVDRLNAAAHSHADIATVTPFSNNATICSYPFEGWGGGTPGTLGLARIDGIFAAVNAARTIEIPTAVGFCMFMRRGCMDRIGLFDPVRFGRGYGEENDFCMRAIKAGWRNLLAADVFVYHEGSVSFSEERFELQKSAQQTLAGIHPDYGMRVYEFLLADEASPLRSGIDRARVAMGGEEAACVMEERTRERSWLVAQLRAAEKLSWEREGRANDLGRLLEESRAAVDLRDRALEHTKGLVTARDVEIEQLRAGLSHAETLAFAREKQLDEIESSRLWKLVKPFATRKNPGPS